MAKLIRDRIPEIIKEDGGKPITYIANDEEYYSRLKEKLTEEVIEFNNDNRVEELADVLEVIHAILNEKNVSFDELEQIRLEKKDKRGGFKRRIILRDIE